MKTKLLGAVAVLALALGNVCAGSDDSKQVTLVYPSSAAESVELDSSTPAKRALPPVREESEFDPVTPLGQVRAILDSITALKDGQTAIADDVSALKRKEREIDLSGVFTKTDGETLTTSMDAVAKKIASVPARSKLLDWTTIATFALVVLQTIILCGQTIAAFVRSRRDALEEEIAKRYLEKQQNSSNKSAGGIT